VIAAQVFSSVNRTLIISLAAQYRLPAMYYERIFTDRGGLIVDGVNYFEDFRPATGYIDRILRGAKPGKLAVQTPTSFELFINLKTAKALGLTVPPTLLARADEVIE
jgi:putative tryptophan/tyrosine transport system substrate-binding protein